MVVLAMLLGCGPAPAPATSPGSVDSAAPVDGAGEGTTFTVAVWMAADNDLEPLVPRDLDELERAAGPRVRVLVQLDRVPGGLLAHGDFSGTRRLELTHDDARGAHPAVLEDLGEVDMGDGAALADFLRWADAEAPADHLVVVLWNHGGGYWIASDDTDDDAIDIATGELSDALQAVADQRGAPVDVVGFDACNMGEWEVAHALRTQARFLTASSAWVGDEGYAYGRAFADLPTDADGRWVAERLAWSAGEAGELTQAAVDLERVGALSDALDGLAGAWLDADLAGFREARDRARGLDPPGRTSGSTWARLADAAAAADPSLAAPAAEVRTALEAAVYARYTQPVVDFASGLTVFADTSRRSVDRYRAGPWAADTRWDELLDRAARR
ncbi:MAG: clostripain-related cysteine peptidase [Myxococcota bacterium]